MPNLLDPIPGSPKPSMTELEPSVYNFEPVKEGEESDEEIEEEMQGGIENDFVYQNDDLGLSLETPGDSLEAKIEETIQAESTELPMTPRSIKATELSNEALTKAISDLSTGGKITPELVKMMTSSDVTDLLAVGI